LRQSSSAANNPFGIFRLIEGLAGVQLASRPAAPAELENHGRSLPIGRLRRWRGHGYRALMDPNAAPPAARGHFIVPEN
jgi:hypothetical protein